MKAIKLTCSCGATAVFEDSDGSYIIRGGERDTQGRKFIIEVQADRWLEIHRDCATPQPEAGR